ncbi:MAG: serine/threonine-protein kinase, partial [Polyangiales bacterium]
MTTSSKRRVVRALQDGLSFGQYQIVHLLAVGGMSEIYEAIHVGLEKRVALKVMRPDFAENAEARARFVSEGVHAARIRHTNVVDVSDVGDVDGLPFLVMERLIGEDLGVVYDRQKGLPIPDLIDILLPVAFAIAEGHAKGVVHRDLKPDNIFLHREGRRVIPKVLDFGVSRVISAKRITLSASVFGTPHYMSPEQARGDTTDERTDQYSLGVMLYEGATGKLPRDSANPLRLLHSVAYESFTPPSSHLPLPDGLEDVIMRAMAHEPTQRFETMHELA